MRKMIVLVVLMVVVEMGAFGQKELDYSKEPPATFEITISGKKYLLVENQELKLDTVFSKPTVVVKLSEVKKFENDVVSFSYPTDFSFRYKETKTGKEWQLMGNTGIIALLEFSKPKSLEELVKHEMASFGEANCTVEKYVKKLGDRTLNGISVDAKMSIGMMKHFFLELPSSDGREHLMVLQEVFGKTINFAEEFERMVSVIDKTVVYKEPSSTVQDKK